MSQILVPGVEFCQEGCVGLGHGGRLRGFAPVVLHIELRGCESWVFAPVGFNECCPELRQGPAQLRVLRNSPRAMPLSGLPIMVMTALCTS